MTNDVEIPELEVLHSSPNEVELAELEVDVANSSHQCCVNRYKLIKFGICYIICFSITFGLSVGIQYGAILPLYMYRGFDLNDRSISYPHLPSRVSGNENIIITLTILFIVLVLRTALDRRVDKVRGLKNLTLLYINRFKSPVFIFEVLIILYGCIVTNFLTNATKSLAGVLKPHFLAECSPNKTLVHQLNGSSYVNEELTKYICTSHPGDKFMDYRRSFPSGHGSQASYAMIMSILVVQYTRVRPEFFSLKGLIQLLIALYLNFISFDRIKDHHHNWTDVLAGDILGGFIALFVWYGYIRRKETRLFCKSKLKTISSPEHPVQIFYTAVEANVDEEAEEKL